MIVQIIPFLAHNSQNYQNHKSLELGIAVKRVVLAILVLFLFCCCCSSVVEQGCCSFAYSFVVRVCYGLSSSLDLMKTVEAIVFSEEPAGGCTGDPGVFWASEPVDEETSPPCGASLLLGLEDFWALTHSYR